MVSYPNAFPPGVLPNYRPGMLHRSAMPVPNQNSRLPLISSNMSYHPHGQDYLPYSNSMTGIHPLAAATSASSHSGLKRKPALTVGLDPMKGMSRMPSTQIVPPRKRYKTSYRVLPRQIRSFVPEGENYHQLLMLEKRLDSILQRVKIQFEHSVKDKNSFRLPRKLRIFISHSYIEPETPTDPLQWVLKLEGRLLNPNSTETEDPLPPARFSAFFSSVIFELDSELYGSDSHLLDWQHKDTQDEKDGILVKRMCDERPVKCDMLLQVLYDPPRYQLEPRLAGLLGTQIQSQQGVLLALWSYIKSQRLQDAHNKEIINLDTHLRAVFSCDTLKFSQLRDALQPHLTAPDPIVVHYMISREGLDKQFSVYDIDVELEDPSYSKIQQFIQNINQPRQEILNINQLIDDQIENITNLRQRREFFMAYSQQPQRFFAEWMSSQTRDLKVIQEVDRKPELERNSDHYQGEWTSDAVTKYIYLKVSSRKQEIDKGIGKN
ncbi:SWI/SNF-related matrix-associated actin-dependent regulator of chromatin subfamily D member 1-like isoform X14 [Oopsacas minuta]|uniref:SWI/SNF-related matrix-associated actin-dependent regulator of chromatin subfamily D member 1-like isoform X14 n=1 Tax=Oopsacas minuta TaxID=111878 RepID=A0AAV7JCF6_9METZ|nr:SWI/SNF-related matrix-associated actin-dependent regulator of chromatin subfamily D member 1-like isoform X14 [Oopsacas minuta]